MKTVEITSDFSGYPNGKDERRFAQGEEPELSNDFAELLIKKGLAREPKPATKPPAKVAPEKETDK